ncbi:hypothetical protein F2Q68_00032960 [Brassica cretica]|uniref:Uncharacterized protein n=1 Tax=Brassica cretica TaxID=69181 RepID=A0A8S9GB76_BRACR|nr:hypothetical protein F2Q68_00032960 [Brassica cretica]
MLRLKHLLLRRSYGSDATVNRILETNGSFVSQRVNGFLSLFFRNLTEKLTDLAGSKYFVDFGESYGAASAEIRSENASGLCIVSSRSCSCTR